MIKVGGLFSASLQLADTAEAGSIKIISYCAGRVPSPSVIKTINEILRLLL